MRICGWPAFRNRNLNPYNALLYGALQEQGARVTEFFPGRVLRERPDVWHIHWPDSLIKGSALAARLRLSMLLWLMDAARLRGIRIVWTIHNLQSHEGGHPRLEPWFWPRFVRRLHGAVSLSEAARDAALARHAGLARIPVEVIPHGHYRGVYPDQVDRAEARRRLGIAPGVPLVCFVGQVRPYKNVPGLIAAFRCAAGPDWVLQVCGEALDAATTAAVRRAAEGDPRVRLRLDHLPDEALQLPLRAADLVVLPFSRVLNSGSALLALSFDCPVVVPEQGSLVELRQQVGPDWVQTYPGEMDAVVLRRAVEWARRDGRGARAPLHRLEWSEIATRHLHLFERLT
jgi:beta-1,4-mannosyltransferase